MKLAGIPIDDAIAPLVGLGAKIATDVLLKVVTEANEDWAYIGVSAIYGLLDRKLEQMAKDTATPLDNVVVKAMMEKIEEYAQEHEIGLPQLDND